MFQKFLRYTSPRSTPVENRCSDIKLLSPGCELGRAPAQAHMLPVLLGTSSPRSLCATAGAWGCWVAPTCRTRPAPNPLSNPHFHPFEGPKGGLSTWGFRVKLEGFQEHSLHFCLLQVAEGGSCKEKTRRKRNRERVNACLPASDTLKLVKAIYRRRRLHNLCFISSPGALARPGCSVPRTAQRRKSQASSST